MKILRCTPTYYDVVYSINPHMKPGEASPTKAQEQWKAIDEVYGKIGVEVEHIEGQPGLPDMVFSANQMLHFRFPDGRLGVIMANMVHPERRGEVPFFARWFEEAEGQRFGGARHKEGSLVVEELCDIGAVVHDSKTVRDRPEKT